MSELGIRIKLDTWEKWKIKAKQDLFLSLASPVAFFIGPVRDKGYKLLGIILPGDSLKGNCIIVELVSAKWGLDMGVLCPHRL